MSEDSEDWGSFESTRRRQLRLGLEMTPTERLHWLDDTVAEMRELQGLAAKRESREKSPSSETDG